MEFFSWNLEFLCHRYFYLSYCPEAAFTVNGQKLAFWESDSSDLFQMLVFRWETLFSGIVYFHLFLQNFWELFRCRCLQLVSWIALWKPHLPVTGCFVNENGCLYWDHLWENSKCDWNKMGL